MELTPQQKLLRQFTDSSERDLQLLTKDMKKQYNLTYREIRALILDYNDRYGLDKLEKYDRKKRLIKQASVKYVAMMGDVNRKLKKTLTKMQQENYLGTGYVLEQATGKRIVTAPLKDIQVYAPLDVIANRTNVVSGLNSLNRSITGGLQLEQSTGEINKNIKDSLNSNANSQIRIDETTTTYNVSNGRMQAMEKASDKGIEVFKVWDAILDRKTRPSHARIDGDVVPMDGKFDNGLSFPRDPTGSAKETVNCRCDLTFITGDGSLQDNYVDYQTWLEGIK
jgi:hypothetical protein